MGKLFQVIVSKDTKERTIEFSVFDNQTALRWFDCLIQASNESQIFEADRWYNFEKSKYSNIDRLSAELTECITQLNDLEPGLINYDFDFGDIQKSVNDLHIHFADSHLVKNRINEKTQMAWHRFNDLLHAFESIERSQRVEAELGQKNASIIVSFKENQKKKLLDEDYHSFTIAKEFGVVYINYCQVGRHFFELFNAQDEIAEDEHILPLQSMSADSYFWFGPSTGRKGLEVKWNSIEKWFKSHEKRFNKMGYFWNDPKLGIGWIPVAKMSETPNSKSEQIKFVAELSQFNKVNKIICDT